MNNKPTQDPKSTEQIKLQLLLKVMGHPGKMSQQIPKVKRPKYH